MPETSTDLVRPLAAEFIGTFALIFIGGGAAIELGVNHDPPVAFAYGLTILVFVSGIRHGICRHQRRPFQPCRNRSVSHWRERFQTVASGPISSPSLPAAYSMWGSVDGCDFRRGTVPVVRDAAAHTGNSGCAVWRGSGVRACAAIDITYRPDRKYLFDESACGLISGTGPHSPASAIRPMAKGLRGLSASNSSKRRSDPPQSLQFQPKE